MELIVKIKKDTLDTDISKIMRYLKTQKCVRKFDLVTDDINTIKSISDKETVEAIHQTTSKALTDFLNKETETIF